MLGGQEAGESVAKINGKVIADQVTQIFSTPPRKDNIDVMMKESPSLSSPLKNKNIPDQSTNSSNSNNNNISPSTSNILEWSATKISSLVKNMVNSPSLNSTNNTIGEQQQSKQQETIHSPILTDKYSSIDNQQQPITTCSSASDIININNQINTLDDNVSISFQDSQKSPMANSKDEIFYSTPTSPANNASAAGNRRFDSMERKNAFAMTASPLQHVTNRMANFDLLSSHQGVVDEFDPLASKPPQQQSNSNNTCLLDLSNDYISGATPRKFSEKDLSEAVSREREKYEKEMEFLQLEIQNLQHKYQISLSGKEEIEAILKNYQDTMDKMIQSAKQKEEQFKKAEDAKVMEKQSLEAELMSVQMSFKELHSRYEDLKIVQETYRRNEETLKEAIKSLQKDVLASESKYDTLKKHAEQKIEEANKEITKVRTSYEAKLLKADIAAKALEETITAKTKENEELMKICEQLIQKME